MVSIENMRSVIDVNTQKNAADTPASRFDFSGLRDVRRNIPCTA